MDPANPIDAVITWVDGADPAHRARLDAFLRDGGAPVAAAAAATRFGDCNEVEYCVASLLRHAPWLRTIHIVSDGQVPAFIAGLRGGALESRVQVVDHRDFYQGFEQYLPTFSNRAIEALMWRLPGLAERYLYFNDDFQLLRPVRPSDFFHEDGVGGVVLRGRWRPQHVLRRGARATLSRLRRALGRPAARPGNHAAQALSARRAGFHVRYLQAPHVPHPIRKPVLEAYFAAHPEMLEHTVRHRLRDEAQLVTTALAAHLELAAGTARVDNRLRGFRLKADAGDEARITRQLAAADADPSVAFGCVQSLDAATPAVRQRVLAWLDARIGGIAPGDAERVAPSLSPCGRG